MSTFIPYEKLEKVVTPGKKVIMTGSDGKEYYGVVLELDMSLSLTGVVVNWENGEEMILPGFYFIEDGDILRIQFSAQVKSRIRA